MEEVKEQAVSVSQEPFLASTADRPEPPASTRSDDIHLRTFRLRSEAQKDLGFYDPSADFRLVFPRITEAVISHLDKVLTGEEHEAAVKLVIDLNVAVKIRLIEEPQTIDRVLFRYLEELHKVPAGVRGLFAELFLVYSMAAFTLLTRREANNDRAMAKNIMQDISVIGMLAMLPEAQAKAVLSTLTRVNSDLVDELSVGPAADPVGLLAESDDGMWLAHEDLKGMAIKLIPLAYKDGSPVTNPDWDTIAAVLDKQAKALAGDDQIMEEALRKAFPTYMKKDFKKCEKKRSTTLFTSIRNFLVRLFTGGKV